MGNLQSNTSKEVFSQFTEFIYNNATNIVNKNDLTCAVGNYAEFESGRGEFCPFSCVNCDINFNQKAEANCQIKAENLNQIQIDIKNNIATQVEQFLKQDSKSIQDWLAAAISLQINDATTATEIANLVQNSIRTDVQNFCQAQVFSNNNAKISLCGTFVNTRFDLAQDVLATGLASCVNKNLVSAVSSNSTLTKLIQDTDQKLSSEQKGATDFIKWIAIIGGIILLLLIIGAGIWFLFMRGGGSSSTTQIYSTTSKPTVGVGPLGAYQFAQSIL